MKKLFTKKKIIGVLMVLTALSICSLSFNKNVNAEADGYKAEDWKPFNYVLTEGAGSNTRYLDIRTKVDYSNNKLTCSGMSTKGGMGVSFVPEIDITDFEINVDLNNWQIASADRWFGFTLTDVLEKTDKFNEVPFYSKHSESWSNEYGAGTLFAVRPKTNGEMTIQFNYIGISPSFNADGDLSSTAGDYDDGYLGWAGYISDIQLFDTNWQPKTDYKNLKFTMKGIYDNAQTLIGIAFDINDGYWARSDWSWPVAADEKGLTKTELSGKLEENVFDDLDLDSNGFLSQAECDNFTHGTAWNDGEDKNTVIPYANYGDSFYSLVKYQEKLKAQNKRLYLSFMYKDAFDIRSGSEPASFTINTVNGKAATQSETLNLMADQVVEGDISGTIKEENLHAGVYPSMIKSFVSVDADAKLYSKAKGEIETLKANNTVKVVTFKAKTENKEVALVSALNLTLDLDKLGVSDIYKVDGTKLEKLEKADNKAILNVADSNEVYVLVLGTGATENNNNNQAKSGCGGFISLSLLSLGLVAVPCFVLRKKEK